MLKKPANHLPVSVAAKWRSVELGEVCDIQLGKMLSPLSKRDIRPVPYLRNANVQWDRFELTDVSTMDFDEREERKFSLLPGDLLVCEGGEPGRAAVWKGEISRCCFQKALHRLRPTRNEVDPHFLMFRLWLGAFAGEFSGSMTTSTISHLPAVRLAKLTVAIPPLPEQRRIAARLREQLAAVAQARAALEAQLAAAEALPEACVREDALDAETTHQPIREVMREVTKGIGEAWRNQPVLGATRRGLAPAKEGVGKHPGRYKPVTPGTVFYNPMRILLGSIALVDEDDTPGITSPDYVVMRGHEGAMHPVWFYQWFRSSAGAEFINSLTRGAVRERLLFNRVAPGLVPVPPWPRQLSTVECIRAATALRTALAAKLAEVEKLPATLLRAAFAGT